MCVCVGRGCNISFSGKRGALLFSVKAIRLYRVLGTHVVESRTSLESRLVAAEMGFRPSTQQKRAFPSSTLLSLKVSDISEDDKIGETKVFFRRPTQRAPMLPQWRQLLQDQSLKAVLRPLLRLPRGPGSQTCSALSGGRASLPTATQSWGRRASGGPEERGAPHPSDALRHVHPWDPGTRGRPGTSL